MCGIFAVSGDKGYNAGDTVLQGLKKLEYRGYDSWGICIADTKHHTITKEVGKISEASVEFEQSERAIGHSRWATHGSVTKYNAHPHSYKSITLVHNGIFENYSEYKKELESQGHQFLSDTDSEVIAHLIAQEKEKGFLIEDAVRSVSQKIHGRFSLLVMDESDSRIICARRGSPLIIGRTPETTYIASDIPAFLDYTKTVNYLDDEEMAIVQNGSVKFFKISSGEQIHKRNIEVSWKDESAEKGKYDHFMIKEIFDQKSSLESAINHSDEEINTFIQALQSGNGVYLVACGTAFIASKTAEYFFARISGRKINVVEASEMPVFERFINEKTVVIAVSQSGETADVLEILEKSKKKGAKILSITNVESSSIARMSQNHLPLRAGKEKAVASTKAGTSQMALLLLLAFSDSNRLNQGRQILLSTSSNINDLLNPRYEEHVKNLSKKIVHSNNIFIIGRHEHYPMAKESALKILEVSYIHAQGFAAGEMKHGPIALIEENTPVIVIGSDPDTISNAIELKSRGAYIIGVSVRNTEVFDQWLRVPNCLEAQAIASIIPVQILAYYLAVLKGLDPDMPRNLAKSVTVK